MMCSKPLKRDADDFLLHGAEGLIKDSREGQVKMARAVESTIATNDVLLVEGPVGVGKSFAYLIPALLSGKRTIVSTAQKALQQQLASIDGPRLVKVLEDDRPGATVAILKGKSNYGCLLHVNQTADVPEFGAWLANSETADLSEYRGKRPAKMRDVTADGCLGAKCRLASKCGYRKVKANAAKASVLIVNHALVAFDLRFGPMSKMFSEYNTLIVDEAHKAPSAFRGAFEDSINSRGDTRILSKMDDLAHVALPVATTSLQKVWAEAFKKVAHLEGTLSPDPFGAIGTDLADMITELNKFTTEHLGEVTRANLENADDHDFDSDVGLELEDFSALAGLGRGLARASDALQKLKEPSVNTLLTAQKEMGRMTLKATPISVGAMVGEKLGMIPSLIFTSATMAIDGSFASFRRDLGLNKIEAPETPAVPAPGAAPVVVNPAAPKPKKIHELVVQSPFDYKAQGAFLYIPRHVKVAVSDTQGTTNDPQRELYLDSIANEVLKLVRVAGGNALVLFTATSDLRGVHSRLEAMDETIPWLTQDIDSGQGAEAVLSKFHETPGGVILGLKSFWEGVSIEGDKLWLVIITKLPFPSPADPLNKAQAQQMEKHLLAQGLDKSEIGFATFQRLSLPPMLTDIRQGAGRLVRTKTDRGVLAILDTRVWTGKTGAAVSMTQKSPKGYGLTALKALGFVGNWTDDFSYVQAKYRQWRKP